MIRLSVARKVLEDCGECYRMMDDETDPVRFRILWIGGLALLRMVGHVIHKKEALNASQREIADRHFKKWKAEPIWKFIEGSRNSALKEYELAIDDAEEIPIFVSYENEPVSWHLLGENIFRPILSGYGAGEDARDVFQGAINWLSNNIDLLEAELANSSP